MSSSTSKGGGKRVSLFKLQRQKAREEGKDVASSSREGFPGTEMLGGHPSACKMRGGGDPSYEEIDKDSNALLQRMSLSEKKEMLDSVKASLNEKQLSYLRTRSSRRTHDKESGKEKEELVPSEVRLHMETTLSGVSLESEKLAWMTQSANSNSYSKLLTRIDTTGNVADVGSIGDNELYHHSDDADRPGYTFEELARFLQSSNSRQKAFAIDLVKKCFRESVSPKLWLEMVNSNIPMFIRVYAFDGSVPEVVLAEGVQALSYILGASTRWRTICSGDNTIYGPCEMKSAFISTASPPQNDALQDIDLGKVDLYRAMIRSGLLVRLANAYCGLKRSTVVGLDKQLLLLIWFCLEYSHSADEGARTQVIASASLWKVIGDECDRYLKTLTSVDAEALGLRLSVLAVLMKFKKECAGLETVLATLRLTIEDTLQSENFCASLTSVTLCPMLSLLWECSKVPLELFSAVGRSLPRNCIETFAVLARCRSQITTIDESITWQQTACDDTCLSFDGTAVAFVKSQVEISDAVLSSRPLPYLPPSLRAKWLHVHAADPATLLATANQWSLAMMKFVYHMIQQADNVDVIPVRTAQCLIYPVEALTDVVERLISASCDRCDSITEDLLATILSCFYTITSCLPRSSSHVVGRIKALAGTLSDGLNSGGLDIAPASVTEDIVNALSGEMPIDSGITIIKENGLACNFFLDITTCLSALMRTQLSPVSSGRIVQACVRHPAQWTILFIHKALAGASGDWDDVFAGSWGSVLSLLGRQLREHERMTVPKCTWQEYSEIVDANLDVWCGEAFRLPPGISVVFGLTSMLTSLIPTNIVSSVRDRVKESHSLQEVIKASFSSFRDELEVITSATGVEVLNFQFGQL